MKNYLLITLLALSFSCSSETDDKNQDENIENTEQTTSDIPDCLKSTITFTYNKVENDSIKYYDKSFDVSGSAGYIDKGQLRMFIGDADNNGEIGLYEYSEVATNCIQISLDDPDVGTFDVTASHTPVQPYNEGNSISFFGENSAFPEGKTSGNIVITELSNNWICGELDVTAYHGGKLQGQFSVPLYDKY